MTVQIFLGNASLFSQLQKFKVIVLSRSEKRLTTAITMTGMLQHYTQSFCSSI